MKIVALLLLGVLLYGAYAVGRRRLRARKKSPKRLFQKLLGLTHDAEVAERLVNKARERFPHLSESALLRRVIKQLERDRGR
ncbi:MAG: hypothetical protein AB8I08_08140 [Sandaracinaceae bacterium]